MTAQEIKALRKRMGLTQEKLAQRLLVSVMTVRRWEKGIHKPLPAIQYDIDLLALERPDGEGETKW